MRREDYREARIAMISLASISIDCWMEVLGEEVPEILIQIHKPWDHQQWRATGDLYFSLGTGRIFRVLGNAFIAPTNKFVTVELLKAKNAADESRDYEDKGLTKMSKRDRSQVMNGFGDGWEVGKTTLFNYRSWKRRDVVIRFRFDYELESLVQFGKPESQTAICSKTGQVFQQTNHCWVATERFVALSYIEKETIRLTAEHEDSLPVFCCW